ncbi:MAG: hypothetical protein LBR21_05870 [Propionibacteriaceae bacterium]|nr:hypothetical protein [Propionibacteriaceae bacterium]
MSAIPCEEVYDVTYVPPRTERAADLARAEHTGPLAKVLPFTPRAVPDFIAPKKAAPKKTAKTTSCIDAKPATVRHAATRPGEEISEKFLAVLVGAFVALIAAALIAVVLSVAASWFAPAADEEPVPYSAPGAATDWGLIPEG